MDLTVISCVLLALIESVNIKEVLSAPRPTKSPSARCCQDTRRDITRISMQLQEIPEGYPEVQTLNLMHNMIDDLPVFVFWNNSYTGLRTLFLQNNRIENVSVNAFKGARQIKQIDLSENLIRSIDPYTFKSNSRLQKLIMMDNLIGFNRLQPFIVSHSLTQLVLSNNRIAQVYETTFLGVPNLRTLHLDGNELSSIAANSFKTLHNLRYLSLARSGVHRLTESMFSTVPRTIDLEKTPLADIFEPPLKKVTGESVVQLLDLSRLMLDETYLHNPH